MSVVDGMPTADVPPTEAVPADPSPGSRRSAVTRVVTTTAVWLLYVPHLAMLRILGPRWARRWALWTARLHWLMTFLGAQRDTRNALTAVHSRLDTDLLVSTIVRKHLELKHDLFARLRLPKPNGALSMCPDVDWTLSDCDREKLVKLDKSDRGLIIVGYHFGYFRLAATAIPEVFREREIVHVSHRVPHYASVAAPSIARLAFRKALQTDKNCGVRVCYVQSRASLLQLYKLLRKGGTIAVAADGMFAQDFLEAPFLGGTLRMPCGWARLAAATGSDILILADTQIEGCSRRAWLYDHVHCQDDSEAVVQKAITEVTRILEEQIQRQPWAWHPWHRLRITDSVAGNPEYCLEIPVREHGKGD